MWELFALAPRIQTANVHVPPRSQFLHCQGTCLSACLPACLSVCLYTTVWPLNCNQNPTSCYTAEVPVSKSLSVEQVSD